MRYFVRGYNLLKLEDNHVTEESEVTHIEEHEGIKIAVTSFRGLGQKGFNYITL